MLSLAKSPHPLLIFSIASDNRGAQMNYTIYNFATLLVVTVKRGEREQVVCMVQCGTINYQYNRARN
jgi:hypothetical protein